MKLKKNIAVSDSGFVFDPSSGNSFTTNLTGLAVIKLLRDQKTLEEIEQTLIDEYDTSEEIVKRDLRDFTGMLSRLKIAE